MTAEARGTRDKNFFCEASSRDCENTVKGKSGREKPLPTASFTPVCNNEVVFREHGCPQCSLALDNTLQLQATTPLYCVDDLFISLTQPRGTLS